MSVIRKTAADWEANAIAESRERGAPSGYSEDTWCHNCACPKPCFCMKDRRVSEMRKFYNSLPRDWLGRIKEPRLIGSWRRDLDGLMTELYKIANGGRYP